MDMEASSAQTLKPAPKSLASVGTLCKYSPTPMKLSQKQRKMLALANKETSVDATASKPTPTVTPSKNSSGKTWATALQSLPSPCSFRALLEEEENIFIRAGQPGTHSCQSAQALPVSVTPVNKRVTFKCADGSEPEKPGVPVREAAIPLIEERAIQDLLFHYKAYDNPDELILVERASSRPMAAPIWNKH
ncbi:inhibitor of Bruton tyrosine kinase-like [Hippocampus comes]|uniref:inhibitor of Bruton tyrosine kinase-like n=1 Tax=Hippocampus comes TaxID=109280 RepID=UPI00094EA246|nr:PREDICTED: inhibitor of Bruton tyrosine kinase-like [Hippocampus comes]